MPDVDAALTNGGDVTSASPWQRDCGESLMTMLRPVHVIPTVVENERVTDDDDLLTSLQPPLAAAAAEYDDVITNDVDYQYQHAADSDTYCHAPVTVTQQGTLTPPAFNLHTVTLTTIPFSSSCAS